jgi:hypothetical protein
LTATANDLPKREKTRVQRPFAITEGFIRNSPVGHFSKNDLWQLGNLEIAVCFRALWRHSSLKLRQNHSQFAMLTKCKFTYEVTRKFISQHITIYTLIRKNYGRNLDAPVPWLITSGRVISLRRYTLMRIRPFFVNLRDFSVGLGEIRSWLIPTYEVGPLGRTCLICYPQRNSSTARTSDGFPLWRKSIVRFMGQSSNVR